MFPICMVELMTQLEYASYVGFVFVVWPLCLRRAALILVCGAAGQGCGVASLALGRVVVWLPVVVV